MATEITLKKNEEAAYWQEYCCLYLILNQLRSKFQCMNDRKSEYTFVCFGIKQLNYWLEYFKLLYKHSVTENTVVQGC